VPELPEVETVRRGLEPGWAGNTIASVRLARAGLRWPFQPDFVARLEGRRVVSLGRRAKYLLATLDSADVLVMHLGMSGSFRMERDDPLGTFHHPRSKNPLHDHVVFTFADGARTVYNDPRRFGFMLVVPQGGMETHPAFAGLGMEPLGNALNTDSLSQALGASRVPLKAALLDQRRIAGLGNIYVCEALHRSHLSPFRPAGLLNKAEAEALVTAIRQVLADAIGAGGSTLRDHTTADGSLGYFQHAFRVYDRAGAPCPTPGCPGTVERAVQSGRSTFWCPSCQI
jgi:formamidopyrimidine-DNA glycosylase